MIGRLTRRWPNALRAVFPRRRVLVVPPGPQGGVGDQAVTRMLARAVVELGATRVGVVVYAPDEDWGLPSDGLPVELVVAPSWPFDRARWSAPVVLDALRSYDHVLIAGNDCIDGGYSDVGTEALFDLGRFADEQGCHVGFVNCSFNQHPTAAATAAFSRLPARIGFWLRDPLSAASFTGATARAARPGAEIAFLVEPRPAAGCAPLDWVRAERAAGRRVFALVPNPMVGTADPLGSPHRRPDPYLAILRELLALDGAENRVVVLPNDARRGVGDLELTTTIAASAPAAVRAATFCAEAPVPAPFLAELFGHVDVLVGARFHALVMALIAGTPIVALEYQDKMRGVLQTIGLEEFWVPCEHGLDPAAIVARVRTALDRAPEIRARIAAAVPTMRARARAMVRDALAGRRGVAG